MYADFNKYEKKCNEQEHLTFLECSLMSAIANKPKRIGEKGERYKRIVNAVQFTFEAFDSKVLLQFQIATDRNYEKENALNFNLLVRARLRGKDEHWPVESTESYSIRS